MKRDHQTRAALIRAAHSTLRALSLTAAAALAACAVGPDYQKQTPQQMLPEQFAPASSAADQPTLDIRDSWWQVFNDPALNELVTLALAHSPDIEAADASIRQARANLGQIASANLPQLNLQSRVGRDQLSTDSEGFANIPFANPQALFSDYRAGLDASWELDFFGHTARNIEAARAQADSVAVQRADVALRVSAETARNVLDWRYLSARLHNTQAIIEANAESLRLVELQRGAGMASALDVKQARIALHNAQALQAPLQSATDATIAALVPLTGQTRDSIQALLQQTFELQPLPAASQFAVSSTVLERRPDVRDAERRLASATAAVGVAVADQYPRFTLVGSAGWESIKPEQFGQQASQYWSVGPQLYLPLFTGNRIENEIRQSEAARDAALANYRKSILAALADVESAMLRCRGDDGRLNQTGDALALQGEQLELTRRRMTVGEASRLDLLQADLLRMNLTDQYLQASLTMAEDLVLLFKSMDGSVQAAPVPH